VIAIEGLEVAAQEETAQQWRSCFREAHDPVRCLAIELEIELALRPTVVPVAVLPEIAAPEAAFGRRRPLHDDADTARLPGDPGLVRGRFGGGDRAAGNRSEPPSCSLAKMQIGSPLAVRRPP
jgi:hypothetical protein